MHSVGNSFSQQFYPLIPLLTPALKADSCKIDHDLFDLRILTVTGVVATIFFATLCIPVTSAFFAPIFSITSLSAPIVFILDYWITQRAADVKAVNEYLTMPFPTEQATRCIQNNVSAAQLLVREAKQQNMLSATLNKCNARGHRFMDYWSDYNDFKAFKILIDNGFNLKQCNRFNNSYFLKLIENENPRYFSYVLQTKKLSVQDFNADEQVKLWMTVPSEKAGKILKSHGLDPDCQDSKGQTALFQLALHTPFSQTLSPEAHCAMLINLGADPNKEISYKEEIKTPLGIAKDPAIKNLMMTMSSQKSTNP